MRPRYSVPAITLARAPHGEASASVALLTPEFGLVRARAQGVRKSGAKLSVALQTLSESEAILVRGKDGWRLSGAVLSHNHLRELPLRARSRAGRVAALYLRLLHGETRDPEPYEAFLSFVRALPTLSDLEGDAAETLAVLRLLFALGLDTGELPGRLFDTETLRAIQQDRRIFIQRINRGITASGL